MEANTLDKTLADLKALVTVPETANFIRSRPAFVRELIEKGELEAIQRKRRQGSRLLIPKESLRRYLERAAR